MAFDLDNEELRATRILNGVDKEIKVGEYELTNLDSEGYYVVKLKDGISYRIYKEGKRDYILRNNNKVYLSDEVRRAVLSNIREYERYGI